MNNAYVKLSDQFSSHRIVLNVYRPDNFLYKSFSTDVIDGTGDISSLPLAKNLDKTSTNFTAILNTALPDRISLSRQIISWRALVNCESFDGVSTVVNPLFEGIVSNCSISGAYASIEILNKAVLLDRNPQLVTSNNCTRVFGSNGCGFVKSGVWIQPTAIAGQNMSFPSTSYTVQAGYLYEIVVGDCSYRVVTLNQPSTGVINGAICQSLPIALPDWVYLTQACDQSIQQCRVYQRTNSYLGVVLSRGVLNYR